MTAGLCQTLMKETGVPSIFVRNTRETVMAWTVKDAGIENRWALAMDRGLNMVSVNGGLLMSPSPDKLMTIDNPYLKAAAEMYEDGLFVTVDLRFLVDAHICIFEDVSSYGRYVCFNQVVNSNNAVLKLARMLFPPAVSSPPPQSLEDKRVYQQRISNKKLNKLMVELHSGLPSQIICSRPRKF
ncbi:Cinnamoyl-CoA reductase-like [Actinidia chinensis var. chinensis]|uniref:Cinnamoyl-CoA reductase-like n=1 Tax=Actinidia chinensis var. chinensis TaxID=1590841 RepID=A0A2R6Q9I1_ACTCC|nr:Cinnamoyl-CoA reductase-like [Actinidia chinensis var. chinensis]